MAPWPTLRSECPTKSFELASKGKPEGKRDDMGNLQTALRGLIDNPTTHEVHSMAPWWIARAKPNAHKQAKESLNREGFEVWYPKAKIIKHPALNTLPSKTRHRLRHATIESERPVFGPYLFIRRFRDNYDVYRLYELTGVSGICTCGEDLVMVSNADIEYLRLRESDGAFNEHHTVSKFRLNAPGMVDPMAQKPHHPAPRVLSSLDTGTERILFVESLGRVTRLIASIEQQDSGPA